MLGIFQLRLETDHVVERAELIILAQLHHGIGFHRGVMGIGKPARFHGAVAQGFRTAFGHHLNWQATIEIGGVGFPLFEIAFFAGNQLADKGVILRLVHRQVDVILTISARTHLVVTRLEPGDVHINAFAVNNGRNRVKKRQILLAREPAHGFSQGRRGEGAGGDDHIVPFGRRQACHLATLDGDERMRLQLGRHMGRKPIPVHGQSPASG